MPANMADSDNNMDIRVLKRTKISVYVDEALPDILVVTYEYGVKVFKGVLLDSTKRNLPCGIETLNPAFNTKASTNADDDSLYSVNQRFAYMNPDNAKKKPVNISTTKQKTNKMTVRLRPRQVLCSKCKGICNENSENVGRKRKLSESIPPPSKRSANAPVTRSANIEALNRRKLNSNLNDINHIQDDDSNIDINPKKPLLTVSNLNTTLKSKSKQIELHSTEHSDCSNEVPDNLEKNIKQTKTNTNTTKKKLIKKKRSIDICEEYVEDNLEETNKNTNNNTSCEASNTCSNTRTIKISYGPQGEGTVLKIPAQIETLNITNETEENVNGENTKLKNRDTNNKAARKALKKAKKEARRKFLMNSSPNYGGNNSPRYTLSGSPRYVVEGVSTRHGLGNNSPRYVSATAYELNMPRRRKHKMKHKKKHREDRKHKEGDTNVLSLEEAAREQCITQKLSINLKRLNNTYTSNNTDRTEESSSDEHNDQVPDFPPPNPPLMLRMNAKTVTSALGADGVRLLVGDVVWGKMHGFAWWPGKVLTITNSENEMPQAHVAWYGSTNSSLMKCDQLCLYLDNFKTRYNKKRRGLYKEAIRQAMTEARENAENRLRDSVVSSPVRSLISVVPPALASPREIDVVS